MLPDVIFQWSLGSSFLFMLAVTGAVAMALHLIFFLPPLQRMSIRIGDLSPILQNLAGTFFALSVAFLASAVWATEDRAHEIVNDEALSIRRVSTYAQSLSGTSRDTVQSLIRDYAKAVQREWPSMSDSESDKPANRDIAALYAAIISGLSDNEQNRMLQQHLLTAVDAMAQAREHRLTAAKESVSDGQWIMVSLLAVLLLVVIAACHGRWPASRAAALVLITFAISIPLFVILAHDRPFAGHQAISPEPILAAGGLLR